MAYTVQWRVLSGELHGFYFEGNDRLRVGTVSQDSYAVDSRGKRYALDVTRVAKGKWDIVLDRGEGVSRDQLPGEDRLADGPHDLVGDRDAVLEVEREGKHGGEGG